MTKAEWSGWAQAIGSALGLGIAIWLPWKSARDAKEEALHFALALTGQVTQNFQQLVQACQEQSWTKLEARHKVLMDSIREMSAFPLSGLGFVQQTLFTAIRSASAEIAHRYSSTISDFNWFRAMEDFKKGAEGARALRDRIRNSRTE